MIAQLATDRQKSYLKDLLHSREVDAEFAERARERMAAGTLTKELASKAIDYCLKATRTPVVNIAKIQEQVEKAFDPQTLEPGVYEVGDKIYRVKLNREKTRKYAQVLNFTVSEALRLTAAGTTIKAQYVYEAGAITKIRPEHRITGHRAEELSIVFTSCIVCGRTLKAATSVARGIGPVCIKKV